MLEGKNRTKKGVILRGFLENRLHIDASIVFAGKNNEH
jgi:hypothetical protein